MPIPCLSPGSPFIQQVFTELLLCAECWALGTTFVWMSGTRGCESPYSVLGGNDAHAELWWLSGDVEKIGRKKV